MAGETGRDAETESLSQGALAEDNKRLQEMLHSALRREAEALRRVKHLSDLLSECRVASSGTPSSGPERRLYVISLRSGHSDLRQSVCVRVCVCSGR